MSTGGSGGKPGGYVLGQLEHRFSSHHAFGVLLAAELVVSDIVRRATHPQRSHEVVGRRRVAGTDRPVSAGPGTSQWLGPPDGVPHVKVPPKPECEAA